MLRCYAPDLIRSDAKWQVPRRKEAPRYGMRGLQALQIAQARMERQGREQANGMSTIMEADISDKDILDRLQEVLRDTFEIDPSRVNPAANLYTDLELDSIDAVDLAIQVQEMTGMRIKPEEFKSVRTVGDVIATMRNLLAR